MDEVTVVAGRLGGKGVVAARDFARGEKVMSYELQPLTREEYLALDPGETMFVHSYYGRRYLYPAPARYVNHSDTPNCRPEFRTLSNVAIRDIQRGEPITIDEMEETRHELATYVIALGAALEGHEGGSLVELIRSDAECWVAGQRHRGGPAVARYARHLSSLRRASATWLVGTGRWEALGSLEPAPDDAWTHGTVLLAVSHGTWQLRYLHLG